MERLITPLAIAATLIGAPVMADSDYISQQQILASLPILQAKFWIQASRDISLEELAAELDLPLTALAELNEQTPAAMLSKGQWLILPTKVENRLSRSLSLDVTSIRRTAPVSAPPGPITEVKVKRGDSIASISKSHGLSLTQFLKLNPGMDLARLVVGSTVRVAEASLEGNTTNTKPLSPREEALLRTIRSKSNFPTWRRYGQCEYDWSGWKLHPNGTRTTAADCGGTLMRWIIAVNCNRLLVATQSRARFTSREWSAWEPPSGPESKFRKGEDEMVAALCANVIP